MLIMLPRTAMPQACHHKLRWVLNRILWSPCSRYNTCFFNYKLRKPWKNLSNSTNLSILPT